MITFDLECSAGHVFEGWFDSLKSFEDQNERRLVACPYCENTNVTKILSPIAVKKSAPDRSMVPQLPINYQQLAKEVVDYIKNNSEDVGSRFTAEALKIHYGVAEKRNIRGSATEEEEKTLKNEGINFFKVPIPVKDDKEN